MLTILQVPPPSCVDVIVRKPNQDKTQREGQSIYAFYGWKLSSEGYFLFYYKQSNVHQVHELIQDLKHIRLPLYTAVRLFSIRSKSTSASRM